MSGERELPLARRPAGTGADGLARRDGGRGLRYQGHGRITECRRACGTRGPAITSTGSGSASTGRRSLLPLIAAPAARYYEQEEWLKSPFRKYTQWALADAARVCLAYGTEYNRADASEQDLLQILNAYSRFEDPVVRDHDARACLLRMAGQQMTWQASEPQALARTAAIFTQTNPLLKPAKYLRPGWDAEVLGCTLQEYVGTAQLVWVSAVKCAGRFDLALFDTPDGELIDRHLSRDTVTRVLDTHFVTTTAQFRADPGDDSLLFDYAGHRRRAASLFRGRCGRLPGAARPAPQGDGVQYARVLALGNQRLVMPSWRWRVLHSPADAPRLMIFLTGAGCRWGRELADAGCTSPWARGSRSLATLMILVSLAPARVRGAPGPVPERDRLPERRRLG